MMAVHLPQYLANLVQPKGTKKDISLCQFVPVLRTLFMLGLEVLELFSGCAFLMSVFRVFVRKKLRVNVPVAIFFRYGGLLVSKVTVLSLLWLSLLCFVNGQQNSGQDILIVL